MIKFKFLLLALSTFFIFSISSLAEPAAQMPTSRIPELGNQLRFNSTASHLVHGTSDELRVWKLSTFQLVKHLAIRNVVSFDLSGDGRYLAYSTRPQRIQVLDLQSGKNVFSFHDDTLRDEARSVSQLGAYHLDFSPDGKFLKAYGDDWGITYKDPYSRIWQTDDWRLVHTSFKDQTLGEWTSWNQLLHQPDDNKNSLAISDPVGFKFVKEFQFPKNLTYRRIDHVDKNQIILNFYSLKNDPLTNHFALLTENASECAFDSYSWADPARGLFNAPLNKPVVYNIYRTFRPYGGTLCTIFRVIENSQNEVLGRLDWADEIDAISNDGDFLALITKKGLLVLDLKQSLTQKRLVPRKMAIR